MQEKASLNLQQHLVGLILQLCGDCGWGLYGEGAWGMIFLRFSVSDQQEREIRAISWTLLDHPQSRVSRRGWNGFGLKSFVGVTGYVGP